MYAVWVSNFFKYVQASTTSKSLLMIALDRCVSFPTFMPSTVLESFILFINLKLGKFCFSEIYEVEKSIRSYHIVSAVEVPMLKVILF
jgi:hypothetical protein